MSITSIEYGPGREQDICLVDIHPAYKNIEEDIVRLAAGDTLEPFVLHPEQGAAPGMPIVRNVFATHPQYPDEIFSAAVGMVSLGEKDNIILSRPDATRTMTSVVPTFGGMLVENGRFVVNTRIAGENIVLGSYTGEELSGKVAYTQYAQSLISDIAVLPTMVAHGSYPDFKLKHDVAGWLVQSKPTNLESIADIVKAHPDQSPLSQLEMVKPVLNKLYNVVGQMHDRGLLHFQLHGGNWGYIKEDNRLKIYIGDWQPPYKHHKNTKLPLEELYDVGRNRVDIFHELYDIGNTLSRSSELLLLSSAVQRVSEEYMLELSSTMLMDCYHAYCKSRYLKINHLDQATIAKAIQNQIEILAQGDPTFKKAPHKLVSEAIGSVFHTVMKMTLDIY